ncbi:MAG: hypothetical protein KAS70_05070 [Planctomycetes bacterium]|nr:hypothetical protein [Planctomycetota bacterium]
MREIKIEQIIATVKKMCIEANCIIGEGVTQALEKALETEESPQGKEIRQ